MNKLPIVLMLLVALLSSGCSLLPEQIDETKGWSASKLYSEAKEALQGGDYELAIKYYELIQARYPFGRYAQQSQLELIYAYYKYDEPEQALAEADRFIKMHPRHPHVDYVYYLKGLVNYNRNFGFLERYLPMDRSQRDQHSAKQSFFDFQELIRRYPESKYSTDARERMIHLRNNVAYYEVHVATYYMKRGAYLAAANRCKEVIEHYPGSQATPDALAVMAGAYKLLGMRDLADDALRVLASNYPDHPGLTQVPKLREGQTLQEQEEENRPWWDYLLNWG